MTLAMSLNTSALLVAQDSYQRAANSRFSCDIARPVSVWADQGGNPVTLRKDRRGGTRRVNFHLVGEGGITFHSLRHSFGTAMAGQGVPMRVLQELMGHRDFAATLIDADYSPSAHQAEWAEAAFAQPG